MNEVQTSLKQDRLRLTDIENKVLEASLGFKGSDDAHDKIQLASQWLGKALSAIGTPSPYPESYNPDSQKIEDRADVYSSPFPEGLLDKGDVSVIKWLRSELKVIEKSIYSDRQMMTDNQMYQDAVRQAYVYCCEATMALGMALNEIKLSEEGDKVKKAEVPLTGDKAAEIVLGETETEVTAPTAEEVVRDKKAASTGENAAGGDLDTSLTLDENIPPQPDSAVETNAEKANETKTDKPAPAVKVEPKLSDLINDEAGPLGNIGQQRTTLSPAKPAVKTPAAKVEAEKGTQIDIPKPEQSKTESDKASEKAKPVK